MLKEKKESLVERVPSTLSSITRDPHERARDIVDTIKNMAKGGSKKESSEESLLRHAIDIAESLGIFTKLKVTKEEVYPEFTNNN